MHQQPWYWHRWLIIFWCEHQKHHLEKILDIRHCTDKNWEGRTPLFWQFSLARLLACCNSFICLYRIKKKKMLKSTCLTGSFTLLALGLWQWEMVSPGRIAKSPVYRTMFIQNQTKSIIYPIKAIKCPHCLPEGSIPKLIFRVTDGHQNYKGNIVTFHIEPCFLHARPWIPGDEKSIFTVVIH